MVVVEVEVGQTGDVVVERRRGRSREIAMNGGLVVECNSTGMERCM